MHVRNKRKATKAYIYFSVGSVLLALIIAIAYAQFSVGKSGNKSIEREKIYDIYKTKFGEEYEYELKKMKNVNFYEVVTTNGEDRCLKVTSEDSIDNNIVLAHMVYTHLNDIMQQKNGNSTRIICDDKDGCFFDTTDKNLGFSDSFCREEYVQAVEKKEDLLYNSSSNIQQ